MKRRLARELTLISAPLLIVAGAAFWASRRPKPVVPVPKKWRIEGKMERSVLSPLEINRGIDTEFRLNFQVLGPKDEQPSTGGTFWNDVRLIETDEHGHQARVWDYGRRFYDSQRDDRKPNGRLCFGGSGTGGANSWDMSYSFALRRFPHPKRRLEVVADSVWRPAPPTPGTIATNINYVNVTQGQIAQMRAQRDALSLSRRWVLRKAGETTPTPRASTDPLFDIRSVQFARVKSPYSTHPAFKVKWNIHWRGPFKKNGSWIFVPAFLTVRDEKNNELGENNGNWLDSDWKKGRDFTASYVDELPYIRDNAKRHDSKTLFVRGRISVNSRWPRSVDLKMPDWVLHEHKAPATRK